MPRRYIREPKTWEDAVAADPSGLESYRDVRDRIAEAGRSLRGLRIPRELGALRGGRVCWPDPPPEYWMQYGREAATYRPLPPTAAEIDRMEEVLSWLMWLNDDQRKFVGAWMMGARWTEICERWHISRSGGHKRLDAICSHLLLCIKERRRRAA